MRMLCTLALLLGACKDKGADTGAVDGGSASALSDCDPTAPTYCGLPFPSTFHMREDATSATGWRINLGATTLPLRAEIDNIPFQPSPQYWNERDGWSVMTPVLAHFPLVSLENVASADSIEASIADDSPTLIVDVATGERIPHMVELDVSQGRTDKSLLKLRPVVALEYGHRYVAAFRDLVDENGAPFEPSEAMAALRDGTELDNDDVKLRRPVYEEVIFPAIEAQGWSRGELQLVTDFVTGSREGITGKIVHMRDEALGLLGEGGPAYTIDNVEMAPNEHTAFRVMGHMTVPLYTDLDGPGSHLTRGPDGMPFINGETSVPFTVIVPNVLVNEARPGALLQYGHGLLGGQGEVHAGYLSEVADRYGYVIFSVDWTGMKSEDVGQITLMLVNDLGNFAILPERSQQGFLEFLYAMRLMSKSLVNDPQMMVTDPVTGATVSLIDPDKRYYYGNSQGGIMGAAYAALSPDIERATLGVNGSPYDLLLTRSRDFETFFLLFQQMYPDQGDVTLWLAYLQTLWDSAEGSGFARTLTADPLPGTPAKQVLMQVAIGDTQVTTLGAHVMARSTGAVLIDEPVRDVWGLSTEASGWTGSALVEWDYGLEEPVENVPPPGEDPHEWPRREFAAQEQMHHFFETGVIQNFCEGRCEDLDRVAN